MDVLTREQRSYCMSRIRAKDTKPEIIVRRLTHAMGFRYRLHDASLPGKPDLVFRGRKKVIFIHGCYWHRHNCKLGRATPKSNTSFWVQKFHENKARDKNVSCRLKALGWKALVIWECQTLRRIPSLALRIRNFLQEE